MQAVEVSGRFVNEQREGIEGEILFLPQVIWLTEGDTTYPTMSPHVRLEDGKFKVLLTRTDQHGLPWSYTVICPMGRWTIKVEQDGPITLKELLPKKLA